MNVGFSRQNPKPLQEDIETKYGLEAVFSLHQYGCHKQEEKVVISSSIHSDCLRAEPVPANTHLVTRNPPPLTKEMGLDTWASNLLNIKANLFTPVLV